MRRSLALTAALCGAALPLLALQDGGLRTTLQRIERSLQHLAGLEERAAQRDPAVIAAILAATEAPLPDPRAAEERLVTLRHEVAGLQAELDEAAAGAPVETPRAPEGESAPGPLTAGLDDAERRALMGRARPGREPVAAPIREPAAYESPEYTADAVRLARVHYRQGMYREGLALLDGRESDLPAAYWKARCLEKLGELAAARALYEQVAAAGGDSFEAQRAREDLQFLAWRERFDANARRAGGKP